MTLFSPTQNSGTLCYLKYDEKFEKEKLYFIRFPVNDYHDIRQTNLEFDFYDVKIEDIRGRETDYKLDDVGFELSKFDTRLKYEDFDGDFNTNSEVYYKEIEEHLKEKLGVTWVGVYDCVVSLFALFHFAYT